jgi:hypothetical protein
MMVDYSMLTVSVRHPRLILGSPAYGQKSQMH